MDSAVIQSLVERLDELLEQYEEPKLNSRESALLRGTLGGQKYTHLSQEPDSALAYYQPGYIGKVIAPPLYKRLTRVLREVGVLKPTETLTQKKAPEYLSRLLDFPSSPAECSAESERDSELFYWVGRKSAIAQCREKLLQDCRILEILGITGIGKTFLTKRLLAEPALKSALSEVIVLNFESPRTSFETLVEMLLGDALSGNPELYGKYPERVIRALVTELQDSPHIVILDMVEESLESDGEGQIRFNDCRFTQLLEEVLRVATMPSRIILTSQIYLPVLNEGRYPLRKYGVTLQGLDEEESLELFAKREIIPSSESALYCLKRIICAHAGHPLTLRTIAGEIREAPYDGSILAYWNDYGSEIEGEAASNNENALFVPRLDCYSPQLTDYVKIRVEKSFDRLLDSAPLAAYLLAMGATYTEAVPRNFWLDMISEYPQNEAKLAFLSLQRRFLLNAVRESDRVFYSVHPLIRRVALENVDRAYARIQS
ncbi:ATP-binding protein [Oscillatoria sp. FACHB-1406]|uniref:ATP-binding protein n=1 Tax=Oscillatoria sp. FACHB-1406 TaxID=2692846 RepID=UPI00168824E4|nr:ATP-binding protein [Oscillatoria sp. FACHB-1406]MBD2576531.1 ATP-binding protein [Oscillatoria sp. FACHB-1406]